ncbi:MAG: CRISPR-associated protein [Bacteroidaceae bacterium]|nr:CRISPR-associated protein [Bacteroidaceae bacterium]
MDIRYKVDFHTYWHCGSGLAAGADVDALVIKDAQGLPFIPGKTMKGLIREAVEDIRRFRGKDLDEGFKNTFGYFEQDKEEMMRGVTFFSNAELMSKEKEAIVANDVARFMYKGVSSTAIGADGVAEEHSLRRTEVAVPCVMYAEILNVPDELVSEIQDALKYIKRLGQKRNRGLGRCTITIEEGGKQ